MTCTWIKPARTFITAEEGCKLIAYRDIRGVWTIGTGLIRLNGRPIVSGMHITQAQADAALDYEMGRTSALLDHIVHVSIADHEAVALASFAFNLGGPALTTSTLLKRLNASDRSGAAAQFIAWDKAHINGGPLVEVAALKARRERERDMFLGLPARVPASPVPAVTADDLNQQQINRLGGGA